MSVSKNYNPSEIEDKWYRHWEESGYFHSTPDDRDAYSIVIPPPNVTGILHMGHMLNNTIQDILIRKARLDGKNACWVPGTDHASIATEAKVVRMLREKGIKKSDLTREEFLKHAWEWTEEYGGIILQQLRKLGASCDWERTAFTMDEVRSKSVIKVFVDLFNKGKLYRKKRIVNWDPEAKTVLSNEEVLYHEEQGHLYHVRYDLADGSGESVIIATTRPETILGDTAIAVHPKDERYVSLGGKRVIVPLIRREIPIIADEYVDREFGTGALKITPAHDPNDFEIGQKHALETIDIFHEDATLNEDAGMFVGMDRFAARKAVVEALEQAGLLVKVEEYTHSVGRSERTNAVVEPRLSLQWYVDMKSLAEPALKSVMEEDIRFMPPSYRNTYRHWMENIRDWCISRQLWWGHRIPAWYLGEEVFVAETAEEALRQAKDKTGNTSLTLSDLKQEEDVLDTWFSSWLWPISVFDGFGADKTDIQYYYPTSVLVTGWDIIFLWVARMVMAGYEWMGDKPFQDVYFTGMVRDKKRRKMSKSLGNSPDALQLISDYGADGVRFGMLSCSPAGGDLLFDEKLPGQGRNFCNKMWNALKLIMMWTPSQEPVSEDVQAVNNLAIGWFESRKNEVFLRVQQQFEEYRLSEALMDLYSFIWNDFCSWYLEMIKPQYGTNTVERTTYETTIRFFEELMTVLHPFMPFVTEEIWHKLRPREAGDDCMKSSYPVIGSVDKTSIERFEQIKDIITKIRDLRNKNGIKQREPLALIAELTPSAEVLLMSRGVKETLIKRSALKEVTLSEQVPSHAIAFVSGTEKFYLISDQKIDTEGEKKRLEAELEYARGFVRSIEKKLSNERFVQNAPAPVVEKERKKLADGQERVRILTESIEQLNG